MLKKLLQDKSKRILYHSYFYGGKMTEIKQDTWSKETGYIWSMIGSAVGFANVLSFSALCYRNGGGAFLIPYLLAHLLIGIPMLFLEGTIGQKTKLPLVAAMGTVVGTKGKMIGWFCVLTCATIGGLYMVLTGFALAYTYFSAAGSIGTDTAHFFNHTFLGDTGSLAVGGTLAKSIFFSTLLVALFAWLVLSRNIRSGVEKICTIFLPMLAILVVGFSIFTFFLPGASIGFYNYLVPDFSRLGNWTLWRDVFGQVFFSLSLGLGIVIGYSRHNPDTFSIPRAMFKVAIGDVLISFISGLAIFGCIGFMSLKSATPFAQLVATESPFEIGFVVFPRILQEFGPLLSTILGPLFFICIFIAGITGVFSIVESVAGNFEVEFSQERKKAVGFAMLLVTLLAIPFCMGNGQHLVGALSPMVLGNAIVFGGIVEVIVFLSFSKVIGNAPIWGTASRRSFSFYALKYVVLPLLMITLLGTFVKEFTTPFGLAGVVRYAWLLVVLLISGALCLRKAPYSQNLNPSSD